MLAPSSPPCPALPSIEPETLVMLGDAVPGWPLPDGRLPVCAAGRIYVVTWDAWQRSLDLRASDAATARQLAPC